MRDYGKRPALTFLILESDLAPGSAATKPAGIRRDVASVLVRFMKEAVPPTPPRHPLSSVRVGMLMSRQQEESPLCTRAVFNQEAYLHTDLVTLLSLVPRA